MRLGNRPEGRAWTHQAWPRRLRRPGCGAHGGPGPRTHRRGRDHSIDDTERGNRAHVGSSRHSAVAVRSRRGLRQYLVEHEGACSVAIIDANPPEVLAVALESARRALLSVRHPEEPEGSFVSYISDVGPQEAGLGFAFDAGDVEAFDGISDRLVRAMLRGLREGGLVDGTLVPGRGAAPPLGHRVRGTTIRIQPAPTVNRESEEPIQGFLVVGETPRPDRRSDYDLYSWGRGGLDRLTTGHFIFDLGHAGDTTLVSEISRTGRPGFDGFGDEVFTRLWRLDGQQLCPVPGIGNPQCAAFDLAPAGHLAWTSEGEVEFTHRATTLQVRWQGATDTEVIDRGESAGPFEWNKGRYLWSPTVRDDGVLAYLRGNDREKELVIRDVDGTQRQYTFPLSVRVQRVVLGSALRLGVEFTRGRDGPLEVGILDVETRTLATATTRTSQRLASRTSLAGEFLRLAPDHATRSTSLECLDLVADVIPVRSAAHLPLEVSLALPIG